MSLVNRRKVFHDCFEVHVQVDQSLLLVKNHKARGCTKKLARYHELFIFRNCLESLEIGEGRRKTIAVVSSEPMLEIENKF